MFEVSKIIGPMRPRFLLLTPACVILGVGTAFWQTGAIAWLDLVLILVGAVAAHISVNAFNEYDDFKSGLDFRTQRTPFSGGTGTLPEHPEAAGKALATAVTTLVITGLVGIYFLATRGMGLLWLGLPGIIMIYIYTNLLTRSSALCLIAPGLGFGTMMVMGTHFALTGTYSWTAFLASLVPFFLVNNLLLLNQFPDVEADRSIGRNHLLIKYGTRTGVLAYVIMLVLVYVALGASILAGYLPIWAALGLLTLAMAIPLIRGVMRNYDNMENLLPFMGMNVGLNLLTPTLIGIGLIVAGVVG